MYAALVLGMVLTASPAPSVAVMPIHANGVSEVSAKILTEQLLDAVRRSNAFSRVVGMGDIEAALQVEQKRQLLDCATDSCAAELAGALGVDFIMVTSLGRLGNAYVLATRLMEARNVNVRATATRQVTGENEQVVLPLIVPLVEALVKQGRLGPEGESAGGAWRLPVRLVGAMGAALGGAFGLLGLGALGAAAAAAILVNVVYVPIHTLPGMEEPGTRAAVWLGGITGAVLLGGAVLLLAVVVLAGGVAGLVVPAVL